MTALAATAASIAFPPRWRIWAPACEASGWLAATMPSVVATFDRPGRTCARGGSCPTATTERTATETTDSSTVRVFITSFSTDVAQGGRYVVRVRLQADLRYRSTLSTMRWSPLW